jgi:hypothetical protein
MVKCKFVVCTNGNTCLWIVLFRGNCDNVFQLYEKHTRCLQNLHLFEFK